MARSRHVPTRGAGADRLQVATHDGTAWRCLRCASFVVGDPRESGPAERAPTILRGNALRDALILRLLAAERLIRGVLLILLAYGVYRFGFDLESAGPVKLIEKALRADHSTLLLVAAGVLAYGVLELVEAAGLWLMKRWGDYVAVVGTSVFLPLEV